jgi:hypothetical protein
MGCMAVCLEEIGSEHRRDQAGHCKTDQHGRDDREAELLEELARNTRHEPDWQEHCNDGHGGRKHCQPDLVGGVD